MSRTILVTAYCDGQIIFTTPNSPLEGIKRCGKSMTARSHKKMTEKITRLGWQELPNGILKCTSCLEKENRGENIRFGKKAG